MRGTKAKALRRYAAKAVQHGVRLGVLKSHAGQVLSSPTRYLYQYLKGHNTMLSVKGGAHD